MVRGSHGHQLAVIRCTLMSVSTLVCQNSLILEFQLYKMPFQNFGKFWKIYWSWCFGFHKELRGYSNNLFFDIRVNRKEVHLTSRFVLLLTSIELYLGWIVSSHRLSPCGPWAWSFGGSCGSYSKVWRIMIGPSFRLSPNSS